MSSRLAASSIKVAQRFLSALDVGPTAYGPLPVSLQGDLQCPRCEGLLTWDDGRDAYVCSSCGWYGANSPIDISQEDLESPLEMRLRMGLLHGTFGKKTQR